MEEKKREEGGIDRDRDKKEKNPLKKQQLKLGSGHNCSSAD